MQIIPAIDLLDGKCVRLSQGEYSTAKIYETDPVLVASNFESKGFKRVHLVDLNGAKAGEIINLEIIKKIRQETSLKLDVGGGVKTEHDLKTLLNLGINYVVVGSLAVKHPDVFENWLKIYGNKKIVLMLDAKGEKLATMGWQQSTETSVYDLLNRFANQVKRVFCTDISKDGMLEGPNFELYESLVKKYPHLQFTASGGISSIADLQKLAQIGLDGVIVGKAIYEGKIDIDKLKPIY